MKVRNKKLEKRINAVIYFCNSTNRNKLFQTKLYKLLYYLDFISMKEVGKPVTDLEYYAWKMGPVPAKFYDEIKEDRVPEKLKNTYFKMMNDETGKIDVQFKCKVKPNLKVFSNKELEILEWIAEVFRDATGGQMSNATHLKNQPWDKTKEEKGLLEKIDFLLAIDDESKIDINIAKERLERITETERIFEFQD